MSDKYKIIDDGSLGGRGVTIFDPSGNDITARVKSYSVRHAAGEMPTLVLEILKPEIEIEVPEDQVEQTVTDSEDRTSLENDHRVWGANG